MAKRFKRNSDSQELADALGISLDTVSRYCRRGMPHGRVGGSYRYSIIECFDWARERGLTGRPGRPDGNGQGDEMKLAKLKKELQLGRRYKILADREEGRVVDAEWMFQENCRLLLDLKNELLEIPGAVAERVVAMKHPREVEALIRERIEDSLERLATGRQRALDEAKANEKTDSV